MLTHLAQNWWLFMLRSLVAVLFGITALVWPGVTLMVMLVLLGVFVLTDGVLALISGIGGLPEKTKRWPLLLDGLLGIVFGILILRYPGVSIIGLIYLAATWAVLTGITRIVLGTMLRREIENEWLQIVDGTLAVLFGVLVMLFPGAGALAIVWTIGIYAILKGALMFSLSLDLRRIEHIQGTGGMRHVPV